MLSFKKIDMRKRDVLDGYVEQSGTIGSDYSIGSWFSWYDVATIEWAEADGALYIKALMGGETVFLSPLTEDEKYAAAVEEIHAYCQAKDIPFKIVFATENQVKHINNYKLSVDIGNSEYIYTPSDLIGLKGTRYHGKRNHIHRFTSSYDFEFVPYTEADFDGVVALMNLWGENREHLPFEEEKRALLNMLTTDYAPARLADVIKIDGKIVGLSIGEITPANVGVVLFEKADMQYEGIYSALNQLFAAKHFQNVRYINRQEDMNIEGLRCAKRSYYPVFMLDKYTITEPDSVQLRALYAEAFDDSESFISHFVERKIKSAKIVTVEENGTIVSALYAFPKRLHLGDSEVDCAFITAVMTLKSARCKGYMTRLLDKALLSLYADGVPLAALFPFKPDFYSRFGFVTVDHYDSLTVEYETGNYKVNECDNAELLAEAYNTYVCGAGYFEVRGHNEFSERLAELYADGGKAYLVSESGKPVGYFLYSDGVEEGAYTYEMLRCARFLDGETVPVLNGNEGGAQVRIVNLSALGAALKCAKGGTFRVTDDVIADNDGCYSSDASGLTRVCDDLCGCPTQTVSELTRHVFDVCGKGRKKGYFVDRY